MPILLGRVTGVGDDSQLLSKQRVEVGERHMRSPQKGDLSEENRRIAGVIRMLQVLDGQI